MRGRPENFYKRIIRKLRAAQKFRELTSAERDDLSRAYRMKEAIEGPSIRRNPITGRYGSYTRTLRKHRSQTRMTGSHESQLAKLHALLLWNVRQLRQSPGNYSGRAAQYRSAAAHVKKALDIMTGYSKP